MANGMPWSQRTKLVQAGEALKGWEQSAQAIGIHIAQMNVRIDPVEQGDPASDVVFEWDTTSNEYLMRTSGT